MPHHHEAEGEGVRHEPRGELVNGFGVPSEESERGPHLHQQANAARDAYVAGRDQFVLHADVAKRCSCGIYAVGACQVCDILLCGQHGASFDGVFLCGAHWHERKKEHEVLMARAAAERERDRLAREEEARLDRAARLPGFPTEGPASGLTIAQALESLVPERKRQFIIERGRWNRRSSYLNGWAICVGASRSGNSDRRHRQYTGLLVDTLGRISNVSWTGADPEAPDDLTSSGGFQIGNYSDEVPDPVLESIRSQLNEWRGIGFRYFV